MIVHADEESDMHELLIFLQQSTAEKKEKLLNIFLDFAKDNYTTDLSFKFNRYQN
jgi:hypothetical protein